MAHCCESFWGGVADLLIARLTAQETAFGRRGWARAYQVEMNGQAAHAALVRLKDHLGYADGRYCTPPGAWEGGSVPPEDVQSLADVLCSLLMNDKRDVAPGCHDRKAQEGWILTPRGTNPTPDRVKFDDLFTRVRNALDVNLV